MNDFHTFYPTMTFIRDLSLFYKSRDMQKRIYDSEQTLTYEILRFIKNQQHKYNFLIEYEYHIYPQQENKGIGDIRVTFPNNTVIIIELKVIHSVKAFGSSKTSRTSRNKKRNKVIDQAIYYAKATKRDFPHKVVIPVSITDENITIHQEIQRQNDYPWNNQNTQCGKN